MRLTISVSWAVSLLLALISTAPIARADAVVTPLGSGGPSNFAIFAFDAPGGTGNGLNINLGSVTGTNANVGVQGTTLYPGSTSFYNTMPSSSVIDGNVYLGTGVVIQNNQAHITGSLLTGQDTFLNGAAADLLAAHTTFNGLQSSAGITLGTISSQITLNPYNPGGLNVVDVNGNVNGGVILNDTTPGTEWVVNITGSLHVNTGQIGSQLALSGTSPSSAYDVVLNIVNPNQGFTTMVPDTLAAIVLAPDNSVLVEGSWTGELAGGGGGNNITIMSGSTLDHPIVPDPSTLVLFGSGMLVAGLRFRKRLLKA